MSANFKIVSLACPGLFLPGRSCWPRLFAVQNGASRVTRVTLYRGQALVTRTVSLETPRGAMEIIVPDLPEQRRSPTSLYAEGGEARKSAPSVSAPGPLGRNLVRKCEN